MKKLPVSWLSIELDQIAHIEMGQSPHRKIYTSYKR